MAKSVSILRPNRNYNAKTIWDEKLNADLVDVYLASESTRPGFTKRLKSLWDAKHPEHNFNAKLLNERAKRLQRKIAPIESVHAEIIDDRTNCSRSAAIATNNRVEFVVDPDVETRWNENLNCVSRFEPHERPYQTKIRKRPNEDLLVSIDYLAARQLDYLRGKHGSVTLLDLNNTLYVAAVTVQMLLSDCKPARRAASESPKKPGWFTQLEARVDSLRRKIAQLTVLLKCQSTNNFTRHQKSLLLKYKKMFGNTKYVTLNSKTQQFKHNLKALTERLRYEKKKHDRATLNRRFALDPKSVYRRMMNAEIDVKEIPAKQELESFWGAVWGTPRPLNAEAEWLTNVRASYCANASQSTYKITETTVTEQLSRLNNNKAPGPDLIVGYWYKNLKFYRSELVFMFEEYLNGSSSLPNWLGITKTRLVAKNQETKLPNNYRPIACENIMLKLYTGCINSFLQDHCTKNEIISPEQTGGRPGAWGCTEQLLINKMVHDEVTAHRRDLMCVWLDYQKAFDSVPHDWMLEALRLAKVPPKLISSIAALPSIWATRLNLLGETSCIESDVIKYKNGILQGDSLSVLLFVLSLNPLSHLLKNMSGYSIGPPGQRDTNLSHLFFVDDLKLFATSKNSMMELLKVVTSYSKDIGMKFGEAKCNYIEISRGKAVTADTPLEINGLKISPIQVGETYRYLGIDESVTYNGPLNKERVTAEYMKRVKKIWTSELSAVNKCIAHNSLAVPVMLPTFGILQWSIDQLEAIDTKTRKLLTSSGNFHRNGDVDRLYLPRTAGGRGIKSIYTTFKARIASLHQHLIAVSGKSPYLRKVALHEQHGISRIARETMEFLHINYDPMCSPRDLGKLIVRAIHSTKKEAFHGKIMHGYLAREMEKKPDVDLQSSLSWYKNRNMTSEFEAYSTAIQEQEIGSKYLLAKRETRGKKGAPNNKCRLCSHAVEDVSHIIAGCDKMATTYYLPLRHDAVALYVWNLIRRRGNAVQPLRMRKQPNSPEGLIETLDGNEYWWNIPIKTCTKTKHNRPDIIHWDHIKKQCMVIEVACPLDTNIIAKEKEKAVIYGPLMRNLQLMHPEYVFSFVPIIIGATGYVSKALSGHLLKLGLTEREVPIVTRKMQVLTVCKTVKIAKTFLKFRM